MAAVIANTRRGRRALNLLEIACHIHAAARDVGGIHALSDRVGLSDQMLRDFLSVSHLIPEVQDLVGAREMDSVDIASRIARLPQEDQLPTAQAVVAGHLDSRDVRAIVALRKAIPDAPIPEVVQRVSSSRDIREYIAEFLVPPDRSDRDDLEERFARVVGPENIRRVEFTGRIGILAMNSEGRRRLQQVAKDRALTKRQLVDRLVRGEIR